MSNLLELNHTEEEHVTHLMDEGHTIDFVYLDFGDYAFLFPDDLKMVLPRSQSSRLRCSISSAWSGT